MLSILDQSPGFFVFIIEKSELCLIFATLSDPQWKLPIVLFHQDFYYLPEGPADHWFVFLGPVVGYRCEWKNGEDREDEFFHGVLVGV